MRVYLDFNLDESYTPTKMIFLAGMGGNDLVEFAVWESDGENGTGAPNGWIDIPLAGVGGTDRVHGVEKDDAFSLRRTRNQSPTKRTPHRPRAKNRSLFQRVSRGPTATPPNGTTSNKTTANLQHASDSDTSDTDSDASDLSSMSTSTPPLSSTPLPAAGNTLKAMVLQVKVCENHQNGKDTHVRGFQVFARDERKAEEVEEEEEEIEEREEKAEDNDDRVKEKVKELKKKRGLKEPSWMGEVELR